MKSICRLISLSASILLLISTSKAIAQTPVQPPAPTPNAGGQTSVYGAAADGSNSKTTAGSAFLDAGIVYHFHKHP